MSQLREEIDADLNPEPIHFTELKSEQNPHPLLCSVCGRSVYADDAGYERCLRSIEYDPDNQFVCDRCDEEIEVAAHGTAYIG